MKSIKAVLLALLLGSSVFASAQGTQTEVTVEKDQTISGKKTFSKGVTLGPILFSALTTTPPQTNGTIVAVSDASATSPCTGGGTGALAKRINGAWDCSGGGGGGGVIDPGSNGIMKRTALNITAPAGSADVIGMFSSCSGIQYLGADGACHTPFVSSVFGRTGAVAAQTGDYTCAQVTGCPPASTGYYVLGNGLVCNGVTDDTAALNTLLATVNTAGGGSIIFPNGRTCKFSSAEITIPNNGDSVPDGASFISTQNPTHWTCDATNLDPQQQVAKGCILDFEFNATNAKLVSLGAGHWEVDHLAFVDKNTDCATFVWITNTSPNFHDNSFNGSTASVNGGPYSCNDVFILGGPGATGPGKTVGSWFQGYAVPQISANWFNQIKRAVVLNNAAQTLMVFNNTVWSGSGCATCGAFELPGSGVYGNTFSYNNIETVHYLYGLNLSGSAANTIILGQTCSDTSDFATLCVRSGGTDTGTLVIGGSAPAGTMISASDLNLNGFLLSTATNQWKTSLHWNGYINLIEQTTNASGTLATEGIWGQSTTQRPVFTKWHNASPFRMMSVEELPTTQTSTATDNFTRANAATLGANWTAITSLTSLQILSNVAATQATGAFEGNYYSNTTFPADQWSLCTIGTVVSNSNNYVGCAVRVQSGAQSLYSIIMTTNGSTLCAIRRFVATVQTDIATCSSPGWGGGITIASGDTLLITAVGTTISAYHNGIPLASVTDSTLTTGSPGVFGFASSAASAVQYTAWTGGYMNCPTGVVTGLVLGSAATCTQSPSLVGLNIAPLSNVGGSTSSVSITGFLNDTNTAPLVNIDTPAGTSGPQQGSFRAGTNGFSQFQVCNSGNGAAAIGYNAFGATVACSGIYQTSPVKNVFMTGNNGHTLIRGWQAGTAQTAPLVQLNTATASGTGFNFLEGWSGVSGTDTYHTGGTNTWSIRGDGQFISTGGFDTSGAAQVKLPVGAGFVTTAQGNQGYDSTNLNWHVWQNAADRLMAVINGSPANNDCAKFVLSGSTISLQSAGAACGSGGGGLSGQTALGIPIAATATTSTSSTTPGTNQGTYLIGRINTVQGTPTTPVEIQAGDCGSPGTISGATTTYTVVYTDVVGCNVVHDRAASGTATITLPTPTTLNNTAPIFVYSNYSPQNDTLTPTTWTISQGTSAAGASLTVNSGFACKVQPDPVNASTWKADCHQMTTSPSGGTVTSFSAGTLSPLFTTSVATATTTPALTFSLSNAAANTVFGNFTGSSAGPSFNAIAACGDATHALSWTAGTGFTCQALTAPSMSNLWLPWATTGEPVGTSLAAQTGAGVNTLTCTGFSVPAPISPTKIVVNVQTTSAAQSFNIGIYDASLNLIRDSGSISCTTGNGVSTTVSSFTLSPGQNYYQCIAFTDATCGVSGTSSNTVFTNISNKNGTREFTCANALAAGALPSACGATTPAGQKKYVTLLE